MTRDHVLFVASAAMAALVLSLSWEEPLIGVATLVGVAALVLVRWLARRRTRRVMRSGNVSEVLRRWQQSTDQLPHPETMGPLMTATALAAYGWVNRAREVLATAERGPAWDAALEQRLFVNTLLHTFEGDLAGAMGLARRLERMPVHGDASGMGQHIAVLRGGVAALARAFSHCAEDGDHSLMLTAGASSPLVHWAMRYGAAIVDVDGGRLVRAQRLISDAPPWPEESCFGRIHREIGNEVRRQLEVGVAASPSDLEPSDAGDGGGASLVDEENDV